MAAKRHSITVTEEEARKAYIVGLGVSPDLANEDNWDYYLVLLVRRGTPDTPVTYDDYILLFREPEEASTALETAGIGDQYILVNDGHAVDINNVFHTLESKSEEGNLLGNLLDFYNLFFDIAEGVNFTLPASHKKLLWAFANHLTVGGSIHAFLSEKRVSRKRIIDNSLWLVGTLFARATFLDNVLRKQQRLKDSSVPNR